MALTSAALVANVNVGVPVNACYLVKCSGCGKTTWAEPIFDPPGEVLTTDHLNVNYRNDKLPMLNQYVRRNQIGAGVHGKVYLCEEVVQRSGVRGHDNGRYVAMKSVRRNNPREEQWKLLRRKALPMSPHLPVGDKLTTTEAKIRKEIAIMKKCRHPHIVRLIEVIDDRLKDKIYMVMEYLGGGEVKWRNSNNEPILTLLQTNRIMRDAILGLEYLHFQGIIHRDIKPANLLWTTDRSHIKIADFGVSHFSYAQRLAHAGASADADDSHDPVLLDDSDLSKRAGTPSFLAPEIVFEHTEGHDQSHPRPEITKAIDIWSLGVTLYCLLFGDTPFHADPNVSSEYSMYNAICNDDWTAPETMALDRIPTGGRHPVDDTTLGGSIIHLLDHFLAKDPAVRITLAEIKRHPWFLREVQKPDKWLRDTSPNKIEVTTAETATAMTNVRFKWGWGTKIQRLFRLVSRTHLSGPNNDDEEADNPRATRSAPKVRTKSARHDDHDFSGSSRAGRSREGETGLQERLTENGRERGGPSENLTISGREKGKKRTEVRIHKNGTDKGKPTKPVERCSSSAAVTQHTAHRSTATVIDTSGLTMRNGHSMGPLSDVNLVSRGTSSSSAQTSPTEGRPKSRFSIYSPSTWGWRSTRNLSLSSQSTSPTATTPNRTQPSSSRITPQSSAICSPVTGTPSTHSPGSPLSPDLSINTEFLGRGVRRSEEALRGQRSGRSSSSGPLTAARRASSWGDNPTEFNDVTSLNSEDHDLDDHCILVGAGGVSNELPFRRSTSFGIHLNSSPLAQVAYDVSRETYGGPYSDDEDQLIDDSSTFASARSVDDEPIRVGGNMPRTDDFDYAYDENEEEEDDDVDDETTSEGPDEGHLSFDTNRRRVQAQDTSNTNPQPPAH
ncbi:hypothetical protein ONZ45_g4287 [Pleurotus djamor]|nr:hypothetical protein ONZ45_g4287 [Pleurotus djamor]